MSSHPAANQPVPANVTPFPERGRFVTAGLPAALTPLVGRAAEVAALAALLRDPSVRLVTLTGPGGVGKTRLALEVAAGLGDAFRDGVAFVPLAAVADPTLVPVTVARALGIKGSSDRPASVVLTDALRRHELLLALDNLEHLLDAAPLLADLLAACPGLTILATSRARLRLSGERAIPVAPLAVPDPERLPPLAKLPTYGAIRLWVERAQAANPTFALTRANAGDVTAICHRLDGLPLAIELAAAWLRLLSPAAILARLTRRLELLTGGPRDQPARLQTMTNAIAWSHDLLTSEQQALFRRLAVFVGGWTLDAAEAVASGSESRATENEGSELATRNPVFDGIIALVDHQLIRQADRTDGGHDADSPRFGMLETIREYGLEQLEAAGESTTIGRRHAEWCLAFAEEAVPQFHTAVEAVTLDRLETEYGNLRAALAWMSECGEAEMALRLAGALGRFWYIHGRMREGREWLERVLALDASETAAPAARARALSWWEHMAAFQGDFGLATTRLEQALAIFRALGDRSGEARVLFQIGGLAEFQGDDEQARPWYEQALALYRELGDMSRVALALENLADAAYRRRAYETAAALAAEALTTSRAGEDVLIVTQALVGVAQVASITGDYDRAVATLKESLALTVAVGHRVGIADALAGCAGLVAATGQPALGARLLGAMDALCDEIGTARVFHRDQHQWAQAAARAALEQRAFAAAWEAGRALTAPQAVAEALEAIDHHLAAPGTAAAPAGSPVGRAARSLSPREREVLRLLTEGASDSEIAERLFISRKTASNHVAAILERLGVANRTAAAALAVRRGLV